MLRIALIEAIQNLAAGALAELRERELANFWANRLMTANRRDPIQLFSILAELAETQPDPSLYFAAQLVDHLYDEEAALTPVQSWLERLTASPCPNSTCANKTGRPRIESTVSGGRAPSATAHPAGLAADLRHLERPGERCLRLDPSGVYYQMDFGTPVIVLARTIEELARGSGLPEDQGRRAGHRPGDGRGS